MQELTVDPIIEEQTSKAIAAAEALVITDEPSYDLAADALSKVKSVGKLIAGKKDGIVKPLNESLKAARDLFRPFETEQANAESIIKRKMIAYRDEVEAAARKREAQLQARVERGTMKVETAIARAETIQRVEPTRGENYRKIKKVRIIDLTKIPAKYFVVDEVALRRDALAIGGLGEVIPGCVVEEVTSLAA